MNTVKFKNGKLEDTSNLQIGEMVQDKDTGEVFVWDGEELKPIKGDLNLSLYEMNKQIISQLPTYSPEQLEEAKDTIVDYVTDRNHKDEYYMLLCHELRYFTIFVRHSNPKENIEDAILDCLSHVGEVKSIERSSDEQALEIWVVVDGEAHAMYFFDYGRGIVLCQ